ncbi:hypothetical protein HPP92_009667 [Vanilla planifolia]|uniref:LOB domain-containing protein n=1 Tax=Vanilla planifolia TaxID=51239 RepID=A0A835RKC7_VANPL|nr:hypothetical protein HPP92_009667 [Vanilla planifolia]
MRISCNGCRVLRKGCSENCSIRPCLQWIKSPESQANATVFLAKFYGRAGLINLISGGPEHLRPAIFRSLLYEACGRIVNPIYGSAGLLWSGSWHLCQAAVESVLMGVPIDPIPSNDAAAAPPPKAYDIRHVKSPDSELNKVRKTRKRFKRSAKARSASPESSAHHWCFAVPAKEFKREGSAGSAAGEFDSMFSAESAEVSHVSQCEPCQSDEGEVSLELTLGFDPAASRHREAKSAVCCEPGEPACEACVPVDLDLVLGV